MPHATRIRYDKYYKSFLELRKLLFKHSNDNLSY